MPPADRHGSTSARAAGQCLTRASFEHPQANVIATHDLHEFHVGAFRKIRMMLDTRPKPLDRRGFHVGYTQYRMRIAHRDRAYVDIRTVDV